MTNEKEEKNVPVQAEPSTGPPCSVQGKPLPGLPRPEQERLLSNLMSFSGAIELASVFDRHGWTLNREIETLLEIIEEARKPSDVMGAIKLIRAIREEALDEAGLNLVIKETRERTMEDGTVQRQEVSAQQLLNTKEKISKLFGIKEEHDVRPRTDESRTEAETKEGDPEGRQTVRTENPTNPTGNEPEDGPEGENTEEEGYQERFSDGEGSEGQDGDPHTDKFPGRNPPIEDPGGGGLATS